LNWISPDFVERLATEYERLTGRAIDLQRVKLISGVLRLSELGGLAHDPVRGGNGEERGGLGEISGVSRRVCAGRGRSAFRTAA